DGLGVGRHILVHAGSAADEGVRSDAHELVDRNQATDDGAIVHGYVSRHLNGVGEDHVVPYHAVVGDVDVSHDETAFAHRRLARARGAAIDGAVFANDRAGADVDPGLLTRVLQILRIGAQDAAVPHADVGPDAGIPLDHHVGRDVRVVSDLHVGPE